MQNFVDNESWNIFNQKDSMVNQFYDFLLKKEINQQEIKTLY